jgi:hypothetical protein
VPGFYSAQGTTVTFDGTPIGYLTGFDVECKAGSLYETTNVTSAVVGTGANARVVKQYDATAVEPPTVSITFWGPASFAATDAGFKAILVFDAPDETISGEAILVSFSHSGRANQWSTGAATFQLTGNLE